MHEAQRVVPERLNLHRLTAPRRDDPSIHLRIHPGELIALCRCGDQTILVHVDAEVRSAHMMLDDRFENRKQVFENRGIAADRHVARDRMEVPQRRIDRVIERLPFSLGKEVRKQAILHIVRERAQDRSRLAESACRKREPFETDHGVAAPVREPVIAGIHAAQLRALCLRQHAFLQSAAGQHDELICCLCELACDRISRRQLAA